MSDKEKSVIERLKELPFPDPGKEWEITPEMDEILDQWAEEMKEHRRQINTGWVNEWRSFKPVFKGQETTYAEMVHGGLTGEGVKYRPIYVTQNGKFIMLATISLVTEAAEKWRKKRGLELFMTRGKVDFVISRVNLEEVKRYGKLMTTEEFLTD